MDYKFEIASLYEEMMLLEFSDAAIKKIAVKFSNDASEEDVRRELADFEKYKAKIEKKDPFQYKTWIELTEVIHAAKKESEEKKDFKKADVESAANADDIVVDDENVTIYKGDSQDKCILYGRGYGFCISRSAGGNMFNNYRLDKESTFYFIFFKKKSPEENDHIMVLDHTNNGYEWTFKDNRTKPVEGGWDEIVASYPELKPYKKFLLNKKLDDDERNFMEKIKNFSRQPSLESFNSFSYKEQAQALKNVTNLPDEIWNVLDSTLRNEFISIGPNLTERQADNLKPNEVARYKKTRALSFDELSKSGLLKINKYEDINKIVASPHAAYKYAANILEWQNVPDEIIKSFASISRYAYEYANDILEWQNVPDEIIRGITSDPHYAYLYANNILKWKNVPDEIIKIIVSVADYAYYYAKNALKGQNVPDEIIKIIASSPFYAYDYAKDVLKGQNVPDEIMKSIASDAQMAYQYAEYVLKGQNVPDIIIKRIAYYANFAYAYATDVLNWQNVPKEIIKSIQDSGKEIPPETTIKENTSRIPTNFNQLFEIASLYEEIMLLEFSDAAIRKIAAKFSGDASEEDVRRELADFEKYKAKIDKKDPFQYKTWIELTEVIHAAKAASEQKKDFKKANVEGVANADDIVVDDENVTIYRGDSQEKCVVYGRGYDFCISRYAGGNMFNSYRIGKESTFYFIFFKKKSPEENDHIMVLDHTRNGYEWTFKDNDTKPVEGGWDEITQKYPELAKYKDLLSNKKLTEEERVFAQRLTRFSNDPNLQKFKEFTYKEQAQALKSIINLPDEIWNVLDSTLRNEFISIGPNLKKRQADDLKPNEVARYKKTRALSFDQLCESDLLNINKYDDINQIASNAKYAHYYAEDVPKGQNVPDEIIRGIASDPYYAYSYAVDVLKGQNVPDEIIRGIASDPHNAYEYTKIILKGQNVPDEFIRSFASDLYYAYLYTKNILQWQNVPDEFIRSFASNAEYAYYYAKHALKWQNAPDIISKSIASDSYYAYLYATDVLNWQNVPKEIIKSIQDSGKEIPAETTIKENTNRILTNFNQLFERVCFLKDL